MEVIDIILMMMTLVMEMTKFTMEIMNGGLVGGKDECMSRDAMEVTTGATRMVMTLTGLVPNGGKVECMSRVAMEVTAGTTRLRAAAPVILAGGS